MAKRENTQLNPAPTIDDGQIREFVFQNMEKMLTLFHSFERDQDSDALENAIRIGDELISNGPDGPWSLSIEIYRDFLQRARTENRGKFRQGSIPQGQQMEASDVLRAMRETLEQLQGTDAPDIFDLEVSKAPLNMDADVHQWAVTPEGEDSSTHEIVKTIMSKAIVYPERKKNLTWKLAEDETFDRVTRDCFALWKELQETGNLQNIITAIERGEEALSITEDTSIRLFPTLWKAGYSSFEKFKLQKGLPDLDRAINLFNKALSITPDNHPGRLLTTILLRKSYQRRYHKTCMSEDRNKLILLTHSLLDMLPTRDRISELYYLGCLYAERWKFAQGAALKSGPAGGIEDLDKGIELQRQAIELTNEGDPERYDYLCEHSRNLGIRYKLVEEVKDLKLALSDAEEVIAATPEGHPHRARRFGILSFHVDQLGGGYTWSAGVDGLQETIERIAEAISMDVSGDSIWTQETEILNRCIFISAAKRFYKPHGQADLHDLDMAIGMLEERVKKTPNDHPDRPNRQESLCLLLSTRFDSLGSLEDLQRVIHILQQSLPSMSIDHPLRLQMLIMLGSHLGMRYHRLQAEEDLAAAIAHHQEALTVTSATHPMRHTALASLAMVLIQASDKESDKVEGNKSGRVKRIEMARDLIQQAIAVCPVENTAERGQLLFLLSQILGDVYIFSKDKDDMKKAKGVLHEAMNVLDEAEHLLRHNDDALYSSALLTRIILKGDFQHTMPPDSGIWKYLKRPFEFLKLVWYCVRSENPVEDHIVSRLFRALRSTWDEDYREAKPFHNLQVVQKAALMLLLQEQYLEASSLLDDAIWLLPSVSPQHLQRDDQQYGLAALANTEIVSLAVSAALLAKKPVFHALTLLETGRGIIMGHSIDCRSTKGLQALQEGHPEVFDKLNNLRLAVDSSLEADPASPDISRRGKRKHHLKELEETLTMIRTLPGFDQFHVSLSPEDTMALACDGPIVIFNTTTFRSDAIIVTRDSIQALPLCRLKFEDIDERMKKLGKELTHTSSLRFYAKRNEGLREFLLWLWDSVVEPVLKTLKFEPKQSISELPTVWWIGAGRLGTAPFHAAGDHSPGSTKNTLSHAISSYIPSIKAFSFAREKDIQLLGDGSRPLLVAMPVTPSHRPLESAGSEVDKIREIVHGRTKTLRLESPTASDVLIQLPLHDAVHFACHGLSDHQNPSESHLLLSSVSGGGEPGEAKVDKLTVRTLSTTNMKRAKIAYLSACSTARNKVDALADESIHIASAFQLAGFSHVLATQWESDDSACKTVSTEFYRLLFDDKAANSVDITGHRRVSAAFHEAVMKVRKKEPNNPLLWAPFIHTGA